MAKQGSVRQALKFLKDCDDMVQLITGSRIKDFVKRGVDLYGDEIKKKAEEFLAVAEEELAVDNPYRILDCRPDADDLVVKGKFRQLVKKLHPDIGSSPDPKQFQRVVESYNAIMEARKQAREARRN